MNVDILIKWWRDERGLESVEYAILAGLLVLAAVAVIASIGLWVANVYTSVNETLQS